MIAGAESFESMAACAQAKAAGTLQACNFGES